MHFVYRCDISHEAHISWILFESTQSNIPSRIAGLHIFGTLAVQRLRTKRCKQYGRCLWMVDA